MRPLFIFDIDGTVALIDHRRPILDEVEDRNRWRRFYAACDKDLPNTPVLSTLERLRITGADIWFFSGRSDEVRGKTADWLAEHTSFMLHEVDGPILTMRELGDYTKDDELKGRWLHNMLNVDRNRLVAVFDDRKRVVDMWRRNGVACFQVADGDF